jgi:hypothetical protein
LWVCDICKTSFNSEAEAIACEKQGIPNVKVGDKLEGGEVTSVGDIYRGPDGKHHRTVTIKKQEWVTHSYNLK